MHKLYNINTLWGLMVLLTLASYSMGALGLSGTGVMLFLLLSVVIKGSYIIRDFMELRDVSLLWRVIMYGWLGIVTLGIAICFMPGTLRS